MILPAITLDRSGADEQPGMKRFTAAEQAGNKLAMAENSEDETISSEPKNASSEGSGEEGSSGGGNDDSSGNTGSDNAGDSGNSGNDNSGSGENPSSGGDDNGSGDNGNGNSDNGGSDNSGSDNGDNGDSSNDGNDGNGSNGDNSGTTGDSDNTDSDGTNSGAAGTGASTGEGAEGAGSGASTGEGAEGAGSGADEGATGTGASEGTTGTDEGLTGTAAEGETAPEGETSVIAAAEEAYEIIEGAPLITEETELVFEDEEKTYKVYVNFDEKAKLPVGVQLEVDEILPGGAGPAVGEGNETTFEEYAAQVEEALHLEEGSESFLRVLDIKLVDEDGHKLVIAAPVDVRIELADMDVNDEIAAKTQIVHFAEKYEDGAYQLLTRVVSGSGSGSAGAGNGNGNGSGITGAGAGSAYAGTGSAGDEDAEIADTETVSRKAKSGDTSEGDANGGAAGNGSATGNGNNGGNGGAGGNGSATGNGGAGKNGGNGNGSAGSATPTVINNANKDNASTIITDDTPIEITTDVVKDVEFEDGAIHFKADSFSAYAIVTGPEPVPVGYDKVTSLDQLTGNALYLSHKLENKETYFFFGNSVVTQGNRKGITKIKPASATPPANAALYYLYRSGARSRVHCGDHWRRCDHDEKRQLVLEPAGRRKRRPVLLLQHTGRSQQRADLLD